MGNILLGFLKFFIGLQFVPLALLNSSKDHYKKFSDVYGEIPSDKDSPSHTPVPSEEEKQVEKGRKSLLVRGKVRGYITCSECNKPRCIYYHSKLTPSEVSKISQIKNSKLYTCGSVLFPPGSSHASIIVVREALVCYKHRHSILQLNSCTLPTCLLLLWNWKAITCG